MEVDKSTVQYALAKSPPSHRAGKDSNLYAIFGPVCFKWCRNYLYLLSGELFKAFKTFGTAGESSEYIYSMQHEGSCRPMRTKGMVEHALSVQYPLLFCEQENRSVNER